MICPSCKKQTKIIRKEISPFVTDKKKIILSTFSHLSMDEWKIWIAEMLQRKSKLVTYMHGGGFVNKYHDFSCFRMCFFVFVFLSF